MRYRRTLQTPDDVIGEAKPVRHMQTPQNIHLRRVSTDDMYNSSSIYYILVYTFNQSRMSLF